MVNGKLFKKAVRSLNVLVKESKSFKWILDIGRMHVRLHLTRNEHRVSLIVGSHSKGMHRGIYVINHANMRASLLSKIKSMRDTDIRIDVSDTKVTLDSSIVFPKMEVEEAFDAIDPSTLKRVEIGFNKDRFQVFAKIMTKADDAKPHLQRVNLSTYGGAWTNGHQMLIDKRMKVGTDIQMNRLMLKVLPLMQGISGVYALQDSTLWKFENGEILSHAYGGYPPVLQVVPEKTSTGMWGEMDSKDFPLKEAKRITDINKDALLYLYSDKGHICMGEKDSPHHMRSKKPQSRFESVPLNIIFTATMMNATKQKFVAYHGKIKDALLLTNDQYDYIQMPMKDYNIS